MDTMTTFASALYDLRWILGAIAAGCAVFAYYDHPIAAQERK